MKYPLIIILLMFSLNALSQVKTGTGGALDAPENTPFSKDEPDSMAASSDQESQIVLFTLLLDKQERHCRSSGPNYMRLQDRDFMQVYLRLSLLKNTFEADEKCQNVDTYFKCLYTDDVKEKLRAIVKDKKTKIYLQKKYNIKKKEADKMIEFFQSIEKGCPNSDCKL